MRAPLMPLEKLSDDELITAIEKELANVDSMIAEFRKPHHAIKAMILIQERAAREQRVIVEEQRQPARLVVRCTVWMTVLTVVIATMTAALLWKTFSPA
jgi:hypothetical protein